MLHSIRSDFSVSVVALILSKGKWIRCDCSSQVEAVAFEGVATYTDLYFSSRAGHFILNITLTRGPFSSLSVLTRTFSLIPAAIVIIGSNLESVYRQGDIIGDVKLAVSLIKNYIYLNNPVLNFAYLSSNF